MSPPHIGPLSGYNSLTDKHLTGYFNNTRIRKHLQRSGLVTRSGRILTEKEYRINAMRRDHQKYIRECLAQAILHRVIDMEHRHQIDFNKKQETFARKERVQRRKVNHSKRAEVEPFPGFSPHPPKGPKSGATRCLGNPEHSDSSESVSSLRPNTAPGILQRPVRLQPLPVCSSSGNVPKISTVSQQKNSANEKEQRLTNTTDKEIMGIMRTAKYSTDISPYRLPIINNFVMPVPPPPQKNPKQTMSTSTRGRRYRQTTAPNESDSPLKEAGKFHKTSLHSNVKITMVYRGKNVHLSHNDTDYKDEIRVFQQHCGGENLCVYKGQLLEEECFTLVSRRHHGFPFSLTFYINGIQVDRLSSCCEFKHRKGARLGGKNGYFRFFNIEGASPCYRCIISMGPDKKLSPPPKIKTKEDKKTGGEEVEGDEDHKERMEEEVNEKIFYNNIHGKVGKTSSTCDEDDDQMIEDKSSIYHEDEEEEENTEACKTEEREAEDDYAEDFEIEEAKSDEKHNEEGQVDDQVQEKSKSPSDGEKDEINQERGAPSKAASETSDSDDEEDKKGKHGAADEEMICAARKIQTFYRERRRPSGQEKKKDRKRTESFSSSSSLDSSSSDDGPGHGDNDETDGDHEAENDKEKETNQVVDNHDLDKDLEVEEPEEADEELLKAHLEQRDMIVNENIGGLDTVVELLSDSSEEDRNTDCVKGGGPLGHIDEEDTPKAEEDLEHKHSSDEEGGEYRQ